MALFRTLVAASFGSVLAGIACAQAVLGTGESGSLTNNLGYLVASTMTQKGGVKMQAQPNDSVKQSLALTSAGEIAFSLSNIQELRAAISGTEQFEGLALPNLRAVARLIDVRPALFVRTDSGIPGIAGLAGKRVPIRYEKQATASAALRHYSQPVGWPKGT